MRSVSDTQRARTTAFTLLEVVVAIGIFSIGMVAVIGLFSPVAKSVGDSADAEAATGVADLLNVNYIPAYPYPTNNVTAVINVPEGCALYAQAITFGNVTNPVSGGVTGILNQAGGLVQTTGTTAEENGIRLGHYPLDQLAG